MLGGWFSKKWFSKKKVDSDRDTEGTAPTSRHAPAYSRLLEVPSRPLPHDLSARECSQEHTANIDARTKVLLGSPCPSDEANVLTSLLSGSAVVVALGHPDPRERAALYFTSPLRAADYLDAALASVPQTKFLALTLPGMIRMLRDIEGMGITHYCLDRCPRCQVAVVYGTSDTRTREDVWKRMCIAMAIHLERTRLYFGYALEAARSGRLEEARDVVLETAGHVAIDVPDIHLLIGQIGIAMNDAPLVNEAKTFLSALRAQKHAEKLARSVELGSAEFSGP